MILSSSSFSFKVILPSCLVYFFLIYCVFLYSFFSSKYFLFASVSFPISTLWLILFLHIRLFSPPTTCNFLSFSFFYFLISLAPFHPLFSFISMQAEILCPLLLQRLDPIVIVMSGFWMLSKLSIKRVQFSPSNDPTFQTIVFAQHLCSFV